MDMGVKEAALFCGVTEKTIYRWLAGNKIPAFRVGSQYRFNEADLTSWAVLSGKSGAASALLPSRLPLSQLLRQGGIFYRVEGHTIQTAIRHMVQLARIESLDEDALVSSLLEREAMAPTAIGNGIALPHLRNPVPLLRMPLLALGFLDRPVDFHALDQRPVHALFLVLSPTAQEHLYILACLSHLLRDEHLSALIQKQALRGDLLGVIERLEQNLSDRG